MLSDRKFAKKFIKFFRQWQLRLKRAEETVERQQRLDNKQKRLYSKAGEAVQLYSYKKQYWTASKRGFTARQERLYTAVQLQNNWGRTARSRCCTSSNWQERQDSKQKGLDSRVQRAECRVQWEGEAGRAELDRQRGESHPNKILIKLGLKINTLLKLRFYLRISRNIAHAGRSQDRGRLRQDHRSKENRKGGRIGWTARKWDYRQWAKETR
jgi:hypothetical protein